MTIFPSTTLHYTLWTWSKPIYNFTINHITNCSCCNKTSVLQFQTLSNDVQGVCIALFTFWFYVNVISYTDMMIKQRFEQRMLVLQHLNIWQKQTHLVFLPWFVLSLANGVTSSPSCTTAKMPSNWGVISLSTGFSCLSSCRYWYSLRTTGCDWTAIRLAFRSR